MASILLNLVADFDTQLSTAASIGGTTATLVSATDDDGNALPTGTYGLTIDAGNSSKEYIICTLTGTSLTSILSITRQGVTSSGFARSHRRGAKVTVTDWAILSRMLKLLNGTGAFDSTAPINYDAHPTFTTDYQIVDKKYVDDIAIAGSPDSSTTLKGIGKVSVAPASATNPIFVGDNDPRVPTQEENDALVGNNTDIAVGTGNKFVTQTGLQHNAEKYAADAGSNDTYVITLSPAPTSYTNGMVVYFKANTANTGAATINVNSLGAKTIVKYVNTTLADGDIAAGMFCTLIYDGTNFVLQNPIANVLTTTYRNGVGSQSGATNTVTITHNLGTTPKKIRLDVYDATGQSVSNQYTLSSNGSWDANGQSSVGIRLSGATNTGTSDASNAANLTLLGIGSTNTSIGNIQNVGATTFDIVWTNTLTSGGNYGQSVFHWEAEG